MVAVVVGNQVKEKLAMGRVTGSSGAYAHNWKKVGHDHYRISWTFDAKISGSRLRWPRTMKRDTDEAGAIRFAKKWGLELPTKTTV